MAKIGRPTTYTDDKADRICELISDGYTLRRISEEFPELPYKRTVLSWLANPSVCPGFSEKYDRARELRSELMAHEIEDIADDARNDWMDRTLGDGSVIRAFDPEHVQRSRLRVETRKWLMAKMLPRKWGDKLAVDHSGTLTLAALVEQAHAQIADRGQTIEGEIVKADMSSAKPPQEDRGK